MHTNETNVFVGTLSLSLSSWGSDGGLLPRGVLGAGSGSRLDTSSALSAGGAAAGGAGGAGGASLSCKVNENLIS